MINEATVSKWLDSYINAWKSYDQQAIGSLFSEDAVYYYGPFDAPVRGRTAIVESWLKSPDTPGTYDAQYRPVAIQGNTAVTNGRSRYVEADGKTPKGEYDNIFLLRFNEVGECSEFREWFMAKKM